MKLEELILLVDLEQCKKLQSDIINYELHEFYLRGGYSNHEALMDILAMLYENLDNIEEAIEHFKKQPSKTAKEKLELKYHFRRLEHCQKQSNSYLKLLKKHKPKESA